MTSRRGFIKSGGLALFGIGMGGVPSFIARAADSDKIISPYKKESISYDFSTRSYGWFNGSNALYRSIS